MIKRICSIAAALLLIVGLCVPADAQTEYYVLTQPIDQSFVCHPDHIQPSDSVFSLCGVICTGLSVYPGFSESGITSAESYDNIGGVFKRMYMLDRDQLDRMQAEWDLKMQHVCSGIQYVPVSSQIVLERNALWEIESHAGDADNGVLNLRFDAPTTLVLHAHDGSDTLWISQTALQYLTRHEAEIRLLPDGGFCLKNRVRQSFHVGDRLRLEGWVDAENDTVTGLEYSWDGGHSWDCFDTTHVDGRQWLYWIAEFDLDQVGTPTLLLRAIDEEAGILPLQCGIALSIEAHP